MNSRFPHPCFQGEDWEYEDDRADDDLEMGKDDDADVPAPKRFLALILDRQ